MTLKIMPHGRLQEWVAQEKGYFTAEGLEYSFVLSEDYGVHRPLPYTREVFAATQHWTEAHRIFTGPAGSAAGYDEAVLA